MKMQTMGHFIRWKMSIFFDFFCLNLSSHFDLKIKKKASVNNINTHSKPLKAFYLSEIQLKLQPICSAYRHGN